MNEDSFTLAQRYTTLVDSFLDKPGVSQDAVITQPGRKFGSSALKVNNKIFAMLTRGRLVVKLPQQRVDALLAEGVGERFDPGHGRLMKEWLAVDPAWEAEWQSLATEALEFVGSRR